MNEIPTWWLVISGAFFGIGVLAFLAMTALFLRLSAVVNELKPKIDNISAKVEALTANLESTSAQAKSTITTVGSGTANIVRSVETALVGSAKRLEGFATVMFTALSILKLVKEFQAVRGKPHVDSSKPDGV
ncbi:MAG: hypothetical protein L6Q31_07255 [Fimbriimonadaceae bacterium]|nr:hypothetical protein [Fimbriimonadaceae bacterium]NUM38996.1 hypothetical protein [Armatimonadota bacterium]